MNLFSVFTHPSPPLICQPKHNPFEILSHFTINNVPKTIQRQIKQYLKQYIKTSFHDLIPLQNQVLAHTSITFVKLYFLLIKI